MKIAIMQPYYYPYIGYFELIKNVDTFVFLDDVQYVKRRWINRNRIRSTNDWQFITVPVVHAPQKTPIYDIEIFNDNWHEKQTKTLLSIYGKKIIENPVFTNFLEQKSKRNLNSLLQDTLIFVSKFLKIETNFISSKDLKSIQHSQDKLIEICKIMGATTYVNASGGKELYSKEDFEKEQIKLEFIDKTKESNTLSILDLILGDGITESTLSKTIS